MTDNKQEPMDPQVTAFAEAYAENAYLVGSSKVDVPLVAYANGMPEWIPSVPYLYFNPTVLQQLPLVYRQSAYQLAAWLVMMAELTLPEDPRCPITFDDLLARVRETASNA